MSSSSSSSKPFWRTEPTADSGASTNMSSDPNTKESASRPPSSDPASQAMPPPADPPVSTITSAPAQQPVTPHKPAEGGKNNSNDTPQAQAQMQLMTPQKSPYNTNATQAAAAPFKPPTPSKAPVNRFATSRAPSMEEIPGGPKDDIKSVELNAVARKELEKQGSGGVSIDPQGGRTRLVKRTAKDSAEIFDDVQNEGAKNNKKPRGEDVGQIGKDNQVSQPRPQVSTVQPQRQSAQPQSSTLSTQDHQPRNQRPQPFPRYWNQPSGEAHVSSQDARQPYQSAPAQGRWTSSQSNQGIGHDRSRALDSRLFQPAASAGPPSTFKAKAVRATFPEGHASFEAAAVSMPFMDVEGDFDNYGYGDGFDPSYGRPEQYYAAQSNAEQNHAKGVEDSSFMYDCNERYDQSHYAPVEDVYEEALPFDPMAEIPLFDVKANLTEPWDRMQQQLPAFLTTYAEELLGNTYDILFLSAALFHKLNKTHQASLTQGVEAIKAEEIKQEKAREVIVHFSQQMQRVAGVLGSFGLDSQLDEIMGARN